MQNKLSSLRQFCLLLVASLFISSDYPKVGEVIDVVDGVAIYYNGSMANVHGRHMSDDHYNFGLKWQCVEFVKRYYYQVYHHKMPNTYGNAKDFFDERLDDVAYNRKRGLMQYRNTRYERPEEGDILVFGSSHENPYGHIGIISDVGKHHIELAQQNWGKKSRTKIKLVEYLGIYTVAEYDVLGWLRKTDQH